MTADMKLHSLEQKDPLTYVYGQSKDKKEKARKLSFSLCFYAAELCFSVSTWAT